MGARCTPNKGLFLSLTDNGLHFVIIFAQMWRKKDDSANEYGGIALFIFWALVSAANGKEISFLRISALEVSFNRKSCGIPFDRNMSGFFILCPKDLLTLQLVTFQEVQQKMPECFCVSHMVSTFCRFFFDGEEQKNIVRKTFLRTRSVEECSIRQGLSCWGRGESGVLSCSGVHVRWWWKSSWCHKWLHWIHLHSLSMHLSRFCELSFFRQISNRVARSELEKLTNLFFTNLISVNLYNWWCCRNILLVCQLQKWWGFLFQNIFGLREKNSFGSDPQEMVSFSWKQKSFLSNIKFSDVAIQFNANFLKLFSACKVPSCLITRAKGFINNDKKSGSWLQFIGFNIRLGFKNELDALIVPG